MTFVSSLGVLLGCLGLVFGHAHGSSLVTPLVLQQSPWPGNSLRPLILETWRKRVEQFGGVHTWSMQYAGNRVFQEWCALLTDAAGGGVEERRLAGDKLRRYVMEPPIRALGRTGTSLPLPGSDGDYDMALVGCISLLGLFESDTLLLPNAVFVHLIRVVDGLFGQRSAGAFDVVVLQFPETENHVFMTEGCRAITNDLIVRNRRNLRELRVLRDSLERSGQVLIGADGGLRTLLLRMMAQVMKQGFFEVNARIYQRFTLHALLNLNAFASDSTLRTGAAIVLDYLGALFAIQSCQGVRWGPYRRSSETFEDSTLYDRDAVASFFGVHSGVFPWSANPDTGLWSFRTAHAGMALWAILMPYRPPEVVLSLLRGNKGWYEAMVMAGSTRASRENRATETYVGGPNFLLVGGGPYESYSGTNFPTQGRFWEETPWVYDLLNRPAGLILAPLHEHPWDMQDILYLRGSMWRAPQAHFDQGVLIGKGEWQNFSTPIHIPSAWPPGRHTQDTAGIKWQWLRPDLGLNITATWPRDRIPLAWFRKNGTSRVTLAITPDSASRAAEPALLDKPETVFVGERGTNRLPFLFPFWSGWEMDTMAKTWARCAGLNNRLPHLAAYPQSQPDLPFICVDGQGHFYAYQVRTGAYVVANFSLWWHPVRRVFP
jgi:hypothetical protein